MPESTNLHVYTAKTNNLPIFSYLWQICNSSFVLIHFCSVARGKYIAWMPESKKNKKKQRMSTNNLDICGRFTRSFVLNQQCRGELCLDARIPMSTPQKQMST